MSDYAEHLISQAGGDGDVLGEIEARDDAVGPLLNLPNLSEGYMALLDRRTLLALVLEQAAKLDLIANQVNAAETLCRMNGAGVEFATVPAEAIRAALEATP